MYPSVDKINAISRALEHLLGKTFATPPAVRVDGDTGTCVVVGPRGTHCVLSPVDDAAGAFSVGKLVHRAPMPGVMPAGPDFVEVARIEGCTCSSVVAALFAGWVLDILAA